MLKMTLSNNSNTIFFDYTDLKFKLSSLGIKIDFDSGHLFYKYNYKPIQLNFDLVFVRHGETYGNCGQTNEFGEIDFELVKTGIKDKEKRIFQGDVDTQINQLTHEGIAQAQNVADKLSTDYMQQHWEPDIILISPLTRARQTAEPFIKKFKLEDRFIIYDQIKEMSFGCWDNRRVCDIDSADPCHLFYTAQHALIKQSGVNATGVHKEGESFGEVILRAYDVLMQLNEQYAGKRILMFSHSMFGAACCILLGKGQKIENGDYLAFDGKRKDGSYYTMPNATPFELNLTQERYRLSI